MEFSRFPVGSKGDAEGLRLCRNVCASTIRNFFGGPIGLEDAYCDSRVIPGIPRNFESTRVERWRSFVDSWRVLFDWYVDSPSCHRNGSDCDLEDKM
jgi:hypothetical protein